MTTPVSDEHRGYLNRIDNARKAVAIAMAVCGLGYVVCVNYVHENTWRSGYWGPKTWLWAIQAFGAGSVVCLLVVVGLIGESLLRAWNGRPLTRWELLAVVPLGLLACIAPFAAIGFGLILYANFALDSLVGVLAIGIAVCLISSVGLVVYARLRRRQGSKPATIVLRAAVLLGLAACIMLAVFVPLRASEGLKQHEIVAALEAMTHHAYCDYGIESDGHTVFTKGRPDSWVPDWLISLAGIDFFHRVVRVDLESPDPNVDDVLPYLRGLKSLKYVVLSTETSADKIRQIEQALPSCEIKYIRSYEERPWPSPPVH